MIATPAGRDAAVVAAVLSGRTGADVAREYGISRERVRQIFGRVVHDGLPDIGTLCGLCNVRYPRTRGQSGDAARRAHHRDHVHVVALEARRIRRQSASIERFWSLVDTNGPRPEFAPHLGPCWLWTGKCDEVNRGFFYGRSTYRGHRFAHRAAYVLAVGPIPDGLQLDHLCRVTRCCNPAHLEAVTPRENVLRGKNGVLRHLRVKRIALTHCLRGHERTPDNLYPGGNCRACQRLRNRAVA